MTVRTVAMLTAGGLAPCLSSAVGGLIERYTEVAPDVRIIAYRNGYAGLLTGDSVEVLSLTPKYLVVPPHLEEIAYQLVTSAVAITSRTLLIVIGVLTWLDYRTEECALTDDAVEPGFRSPPNRRNWVRWHETYIVGFVGLSLIIVWVLAVRRQRGGLQTGAAA